MRRAIIGAARNGAAAGAPMRGSGSSKPQISGTGTALLFAGGGASIAPRMVDGAVRRNDAFRRSIAVARIAGPVASAFVTGGSGSATGGGGIGSCAERFRPSRAALGRVRSSE